MTTDLKFSRQTGILDPEDIKSEGVLVIGAGGIGSWVVDSITRVGFEDVTVYDNDEVEEGNRGTQLYRKQDVGKQKVNALKEVIRDFSDVEIDGKNELYDGQEFREIVICTVDSMEARHKIWAKIKMNPAVMRYVDARMGKEQMDIYTINPTDIDDIKLYEAELHLPEEATPVPCSEKAIAYNVKVISGLVMSNLKKFILNGSHHRKVVFDLKTMVMILKQ